jgi:hypothetical protein
MSKNDFSITMLAVIGAALVMTTIILTVIFLTQ